MNNPKSPAVAVAMGSATTLGIERRTLLAASAVFAVVLTGYVWTMAPTVTFWDAGEFIAATKILGVPHPPGTPAFVLLAHVWSDILRFGEYAFRTNLMTAVFSAAGATFFFLLVVEALKGRGNEDPGRIFTYGGAVAAVLCSAFAFTVWQNSTETEVYMVSTFTIAAVCWLAWLWREQRETSRAPRILLLIVYLLAFSVGNHLLALLAGPAIIGYLFHVMRTEPAATPGRRVAERGHLAVITGAWALLLGTGLGSPTLLAAAAVVFVVAAFFAARSAKNDGIWFGAMALVVGFVGVSIYLVVFIRAGLHPAINEGDPSTWDALVSVISRKQYPPRSPWDNPIFTGDDPLNTGRGWSFIWLQVVQYLQYWDWQWSDGLASASRVFAPIRLPFTLLFTALGIYGAGKLRERDRSVFWMLLLLFLATGPGLVAYMNFKPGYSLGWGQFPQAFMHEVRERDYFFTVSFQVWGLFCGIGLAGLFGTLSQMTRARSSAPDRRIHTAVPAAVFLVALLPATLNHGSADRSHGPEARLAQDFAYDILQTIEPYGIVFTYADNDTFPVWHAQVVERLRPDVSVVNLSLSNTPWYLEQLRDSAVQDFEPEQAPQFAVSESVRPVQPLHDWTDDEIRSVTARVLQRDVRFRAGRIDRVYPAGSEWYPMNVLILKVIQDNWRTRPIYFSITAGQSNWMGLDDYLTQEGLAMRLHPAVPPDPGELAPGILSVPVDVERTDTLARDVYRYGGLLDEDRAVLSPAEARAAANLSVPLLSLGRAYASRGDAARALDSFRRAQRLSPRPEIAELLQGSE